MTHHHHTHRPKHFWGFLHQGLRACWPRRLRARLWMGFGLMLVLVVVLALVSATRMRAMNAALEHYATRTTPALQAVRQAQALAADIRLQQGQHLMTVSLEEMQPLEAGVAQAFAQLQSSTLVQPAPSDDAQAQEVRQALHDNIALQQGLWQKISELSRAALQEPERAEHAGLRALGAAAGLGLCAGAGARAECGLWRAARRGAPNWRGAP